MTRPARAAAAAAASAALAAAFALGHFTVPAHGRAPAPPAAPRPSGAELARDVRAAADAFVGAVRAHDSAGICALMTAQQRRWASNDQGTCHAAASIYSTDYSEDQVLMGRVVLVNRRTAIVGEVWHGQATLWTFKLRRGRWLMARAARAPTS